MTKTTSPKASPKPPAGAPLQVQCAWCRMWKVNSEWVSMPLTGATGAVSHGICPPCEVATGWGTGET